ncbi:GatB/YqeY domain-containing protein [Candidatus Daviesbacteria bacterium]|nr:GatB/YqeY domain-containing protein [Candidatus Daviesbacteria bacterium]
MLIDKIQEDLKQSQLRRDEIKTSTLRLLLSEVKNAQIAKGGDLSDEEVIIIAQKEVKKRSEAAAGFRLGGKEDQALKEEAERKVLESYLPVQLSEEALTKIVEESIKELGASSIQDMGRVMGMVMGKVKGQADGGVVSALVKEKLS